MQDFFFLQLPANTIQSEHMKLILFLKCKLYM